MMENKKILVLGLGKSGYYVTKLLYKQNKIVTTDSKMPSEDVLSEFQKLNIDFIQSATGAEILDASFELVIKSPGVHPSQECIMKASKLNIPIVNEMEVAYHYLPKDVKIIGVTGSNGKTTTTTMIYDLLKIHHVPVILGGNIGYPLSQIVENVHHGDVVLLEISDHQLFNFQDFKTNISVLTNLCPTHLDFHGNYENYKNVKKKIFNHHTLNDVAIINKQNADSMELTQDIASSKIYFNDSKNYYNAEGIFLNQELIVKLEDIKIKGSHNYENILASLLVLKEFTLDKELVKNYLAHFNGVEHRLEIVDSKSKINFFNDSKSTNPTSTLIALKTMQNKTHLILGGMERKQDFQEVSGGLKIVKCIYAIGEVTDRIFTYAQSQNIPCYKCYTLDKAMEVIKENAQDNENVLLSPGSASWDQYDKFETRGNEFKKLVEKLFD